MKTLLILAFLLFPGFTYAQEYLVTLEIYTSTFTLNPLKHLKNHLNAVEITLPTTKDFYENVKEGQKLSEGFKCGSFFISGSISDLVVKIKKKEVK